MPELEQVDRNSRRSTKASYASEELELLLFLQHAEGKKAIGGKNGLISYYRHPERRADLELLGFAHPREIPDGLRAERKDAIDGLPRGARFTQYAARMPLHRRCELWRQLYAEVRAMELALMPVEELRVLYGDSTHAETIYTCPV